MEKNYHNMLNEKTIKLLEFDKIRESVACFASSELSRAEILGAKPSFNATEIRYALNLTTEAYKMMSVYLLDPYCGFDDVSEILEKARANSTLSMGELLKVAKLIKTARILKSTIENAPEDIIELKKIISGVMIDHLLEKNIFDWIINENEMSDRASEKLYGLRKKIQNLNFKLKEKLISYTKNNSASKFLQDNLVTVREGRYVLPVKSECRGEVKGLVHDRSATGSTLFIEPFAVVELNNELREAMLEEAAEVERILADLTKRVDMSSISIFACQNACLYIDIVLCKAKYSLKNRSILPEFNDNKMVYLQKSRHPLIENTKVVPVDIKVGGEYSVLLITGPNTGGKTVCLKSVGLFCLMAYFGLFLPCEKASVCLFDNIYCDIGDEQSIENELSTFSSHVNSLIYITENMTENSLVLLDEVGGGTDPDEGASLAKGVVNFILNKGATAVLTTHYGQLKEFAIGAKHIENACMEFNEETLAPTFKLILGMPGSSNALKIAKRLGLNNEIIEHAIESLPKDKVEFEKIIEHAENIRRIASAELEQTVKIKDDLLAQKRQIDIKTKQLDDAMAKIKLNAQAETKRLISGSLERANDIIDEMKDLIEKADEASILQAKKLRSELEDIAYQMSDDKIDVEVSPILASDIKVGATVIVKTLGAVGVIKSVNQGRKTVEVQVGSLRSKAKFSDLGHYNAPKSETKVKQIKPTSGDKIGSGFSEKEIKVLGLTVSEAIEVIEPYIISMASDNDAKILKIVHGKGTGALGKGIHQFLKKYPLVLEFRYGRYGEGDSGVTFVTVK